MRQHRAVRRAQGNKQDVRRWRGTGRREHAVGRAAGRNRAGAGGGAREGPQARSRARTRGRVVEARESRSRTTVVGDAARRTPAAAHPSPGGSVAPAQGPQRRAGHLSSFLHRFVEACLTVPFSLVSSAASPPLRAIPREPGDRAFRPGMRACQPPRGISSSGTTTRASTTCVASRDRSATSIGRRSPIHSEDSTARIGLI